MRKPTEITPWLTAEQLRTWVKSAPDKAAHERRMAVWLTQEGPFSLGNHPKAAIDYHLKTGHRETA
jgi:hypothetical protein